MSFSSFLPFPFVHSFDNTVVFCADFGQYVLLCIFNAKAMENGLIFIKASLRSRLASLAIFTRKWPVFS